MKTNLKGVFVSINVYKFFNWVGGAINVYICNVWH